MTTAAFRLTDGERRVFRKREAISVSEWAARNLIVQDGPYAGSRLRMDVAPYLAGIMDAFGDPHVEEVIVCGAHQVGKTLAMYSCLGYAIDRWPGPKMLAMPSDQMVERVETEKLRPLLKSSPALRRNLGKMTSGHIRFIDGSSLFLSSAASPSQRASITVRILLLDEEDLYKIEAGRGLPVEEFKGRTRSYSFSRKIIRVSKPVGDESSSIWRGVTVEADELRVYEAKCPACGTYQEMSHHRLFVPEGEKDPGKIVSGEMARYRCAHCKYPWTDHARDRAVADGRWRAKRMSPRPRVIGFHLPAMLSSSVSLSDILAKWIRAKRSDSPDLMMDFRNGDLARPYRPTELAASEEQILSRKAMHLPSQTVPAEAVALTCGIDTQKDHFWFVVLAWATDMRCWLVDYGQLREWEDVEALVHETAYPVQGRPGEEMGIWRAAIDSGGNSSEHGVLTRTEEVYAWCREMGGGRVFPCKGRSREHHVPVSWTVVDKLPRSGRAIPGGLTLYLLDVHYLKTLVFKRLQPDARQPMRLHAQTGSDYARQITAERLVRGRDGRLRWEELSRENHYLDCTVLAHACADGSWSPSLQYMAAQDAGADDAPELHDQGEPELSTMAQAQRRASEVLAGRNRVA